MINPATAGFVLFGENLGEEVVELGGGLIFLAIMLQ